MIDLVIEIASFFLALFFLMPVMLILAVLLHAVNDLIHKHGLWHKEDTARPSGH